MRSLRPLKPDYIRGLTLLGGDPFEPENQKALLPFMRESEGGVPGEGCGAYTGYVLDRDLVPARKMLHRRYRGAASHDRCAGGRTVCDGAS